MAFNSIPSITVKKALNKIIAFCQSTTDAHVLKKNSFVPTLETNTYLQTGSISLFPGLLEFVVPKTYFAILVRAYRDLGLIPVEIEDSRSRHQFLQIGALTFHNGPNPFYLEEKYRVSMAFRKLTDKFASEHRIGLLSEEERLICRKTDHKPGSQSLLNPELVVSITKQDFDHFYPWLIAQGGEPEHCDLFGATQSLVRIEGIEITHEWVSKFPQPYSLVV